MSSLMLLPVASGFSLPLTALLGVEAAWALVLAAPHPLNAPGVALAQLTRTKTGSTVVYTLSAVMIVLMMAPLYDAWRLGQAAQAAGDAAAAAAAAGLPAGALAGQTHATDTGAQARTELNLMLTAGVLGGLHLLRAFGGALARAECLEASVAELRTRLGEIGAGGEEEESAEVVGGKGAAAAVAPESSGKEE